jgi:hypothetical protein
MVRIQCGAFQAFTAKIEEVDEARDCLSVMVRIFGRTEPIELRFVDVERFRLRKKNNGKEISGYIKLQFRQVKANPAPPITPALGQHGVNIVGFCKAFNAKTAQMDPDMKIPVVITVYADRSFTFETKTPPAADR